MKKSEKHISLLTERLKFIERISVLDAVELLNITESSVRRIFSRMENENLAIRTHGGIVKLSAEANSYNYDEVEAHAVSEKRKIATEAAKIIVKQNNVYLDSGSTLYRVSLAIANIAKHYPCKNLHIFTNSLKNLEVLQNKVSIRLSGGDYRVARRDFCGFLAENAISSLNFDICILGADGVDLKKGLMTTDFETAKLCMLAIKRSAKKILVVDSSKFEKSALISYANISDITTVITDDGISQEKLDELSKLNIEVIVV